MLIVGWLCVLAIPIITIWAYFDIVGLKKKGIRKLEEHDAWVASMIKLMSNAPTRTLKEKRNMK